MVFRGAGVDSEIEAGLFNGVLCGGDFSGARGGGAKGGGNLVGNGDEVIILDNSLSCDASSTSSFALGTMSERNSRSSVDKAREFRGLDPEFLVREKRVRNRETAEGV